MSTVMGDRMDRSIALTMACSFVAQSFVFLAFSLGGGFFAHYVALFLPLALGYHIFIFILLHVFKADFVIESTGVRLEKINLANRITLFRLTTLPTILVLILAARDYPIRVPLLVLIVLVFLSDFADGYVSRKGGEVTRVGRMMDSTSDYSLLIVLTIVFYYFTLIPSWFFFLVVGRLALQTVLMAILVAVKKRIEPRTTFLGKAAVACIMTLYAAELLRIVLGRAGSPVITALEWIVGAVVATSIVDKLVAFFRSLGEAKQ